MSSITQGLHIWPTGDNAEWLKIHKQSLYLHY
jgi:hypothetical protein